jgi:hypothetical protein
LEFYEEVVKMLVKITTKCSMGCTHCMEEALPEGECMSMDIFEKTLSFIEKFYDGLRIIMISGGEPTEHPEILKIIKRVKDWYVILLSNGLFLSTSLRDPILNSKINVQIYNDPRYYPIRIEPIVYPQLIFSDTINMLSPLGRAKKNKMQCNRQAPLCFNLRSCVRHTQSIQKGVMALRYRGKFCSPSIDVFGNVHAGESRLCHTIGTIESSNDVLLNNLLLMKCNKCGLEDKLGPEHLTAIYG